MAITLTETDTNGGCSVDPWCSADPALSGYNRNATSGGVAGVTETTVTGSDTQDVDKVAVRFQSAASEPNSISWESGTWTVRLEVTTANMSLSWEKCYICRLDSTGCASLATVGSVSALAIDLGTAGVKTATVSGAAQTAAASDRMGIALSLNGNGMLQTFGVKPSQNIDTPVTQGGGGAPAFDLDRIERYFGRGFGRGYDRGTA